MDWLVQIHSWWRWIVLIAAVAAIVLSILALNGSRPWDALTDRAGMAYTITLDIQAVIGILVWLFAYERNDTFLTFFHPLFMIVAVALAHIGRVRADRATESRGKGRQATLFFGLSLVIILLNIPLAAWPI